jgi:hypothetical protein
MRNWMSSFLVGIVGLTITAPSGALAETESVEPTLFIRSNLVREQAGSFEVNHDSLCVMRDAEAKTSERARVRVYATAPAEVISRDQLVALVTRLESVFLMGIGEAWRPGATAMTMAQILDCRPRRSSSGDADQEKGSAAYQTDFDGDAGIPSPLDPSTTGRGKPLGSAVARFSDQTARSLSDLSKFVPNREGLATDHKT